MCPQACSSDVATLAAIAALPTIADIKTQILALDYEHQPDALLSQANPVSNTIYPVLAATANVRLIGVYAKITWATTQPTNMRVIVTIDGQVITYTIAAPVTTSKYSAGNCSCLTPATQLLIISTTSIEQMRSFLLEGKNVQVDVAITWGTTQPSPLVCSVVWAKRV